MKRSQRMAVARETVEITNRGYYEIDGLRVDISEAIQQCLDGTRSYSPEDLEALRDQVLSTTANGFETQIEVVNATTLIGLARLGKQSAQPVTVLNFASAKNPGGGFLNGSQAQEESLARSSALHASLMKEFDFYERHRSFSSCLYTNSMIWSPVCPVFRDDNGLLLAKPMVANFITSPAPNFGAIADKNESELDLVPGVLKIRSELVLALAAAHGCSHLILGAWGCGVFRNDPKLVASIFAAHLFGLWAGKFQSVLFSVYDSDPKQMTFTAFQEALRLE